MRSKIFQQKHKTVLLANLTNYFQHISWAFEKLSQILYCFECYEMQNWITEVCLFLVINRQSSIWPFSMWSVYVHYWIIWAKICLMLLSEWFNVGYAKSYTNKHWENLLVCNILWSHLYDSLMELAYWTVLVVHMIL